MTDIHIRAFRPDDIDWLTQQHQEIYSREEGFDDTFGPLVRSILDAFVAQHDPDCEAGWIAEVGGVPAGSIFCVRLDATTAKLRLFQLMPAARGRGLGARLLSQCMAFAQKSGYSGMQLWTHESHRAACALYEKTGWTLEDAVPVRSFGQDLVEQTWRFRF